MVIEPLAKENGKINKTQMENISSLFVYIHVYIHMLKNITNLSSTPPLFEKLKQDNKAVTIIPVTICDTILTKEWIGRRQTRRIQAQKSQTK